MNFTPYLHFQGNCAEAMTAYADIFGGTLELSRFCEIPDCPPEFQGCDLVLHAMLTTPTATLLASDYPPGAAGEVGEAQKAVSISYDAPDLAKARALFDRLVQGGVEIMPFAATFWSPDFGMVQDRFGTHWMISVPRSA